MPIILEDNDSQAVQAAVKQRPQYSPKDYCTVLTGNGINQGLLRSSLTVEGSDNVTQTAVSLLLAERDLCTNKPHHVHDDVKNYTTLHQTISVCGGFAKLAAKGARAATPLSVMTDHFLSFETPQGEKVTYRSRLFLLKLYVYKGTTNYVLASYCLIVANEADPLDNTVQAYDALYQAVKSQDPITDMYMLAKQAIESRHTADTLVSDDAMALAGADKARSMYDLVMSELEILKTPGTLKSVLQAASAAGYDALSYANAVLNLVNLPFSLYQSDVVDVVNSRTRDEAKKLKNANMSLSLADTLSSMQGLTALQVPELVGKKYATNQLVLTTEQIAAIESSSKITIVAAGAGTGKSSCIMHRLAFMEENGCDMKQTFVLSFTRAAAQHIKKNFKDCKSSTIADFTHSFVNVILDDGSGTRVDIIAHSDFVQKLKIQIEDLENAGILQPSTRKALKDFYLAAKDIENRQSSLLDMLDLTLNPEANNILSVLKLMHVSSLELDPVIFHTQLGVLKPNVEHIVIDESQDSNRLEFLTMLKMAMMNDISVYIVGDCAQTLYEFRDADPRILNNLTKLFATYDLSINHRSTQIILDVANLMSATMSTHSTTLRANQVMQITKQAIDDTIVINTYDKVTDPDTAKVLDDWLELRLGKNESVAVIARSGKDVEKLFEYLKTRYGSKYNVQNITSQRRSDITILSQIGASLKKIVPPPAPAGTAQASGTAAQAQQASPAPSQNAAQPAAAAPAPAQNAPQAPAGTTAGAVTWPGFEALIRNENIRINALAKGGGRYNTSGPAVNKVTLDWLAERQAEGPKILAALNDPAQYDAEIRRLQMSLLDAQTEKNNTLQRVMDAKNAKLKEQKADIVVCTVHGVKGLEYDHVACFINTEAGKASHYSVSDENKRIAYVALTRAKLSECIFCTREKLVKDFAAYREAMP